MSKWQRAEDVEPPKDRPFLFLHDGAYNIVQWCDPWEEGEEDWFTDAEDWIGFRCFNGHWQPLPEAPEGV